jgi:DNA-binding XRE family transcriptional regulator
MRKYNVMSFDELSDELIGKVGTPERDAIDKQIDNEMRAFHFGEALRQARIYKGLTQSQFGEMIGVEKTQVSKMEKGCNMSIGRMTKAFNALGVGITLHFGDKRMEV